MELVTHLKGQEDSMGLGTKSYRCRSLLDCLLSIFDLWNDESARVSIDLRTSHMNDMSSPDADALEGSKVRRMNSAIRNAWIKKSLTCSRTHECGVVRVVGVSEL